MDEEKWPPATMGKVRTDELLRSLDVLGVKEHHFLEGPIDTDMTEAPVQPPLPAQGQPPSEPPRRLQFSATYTPEVIEDIQAKAELGRYRIRGFGTLRERRWATFDDLTFLPCSLTRIPLEGYRERCVTRTVLGTRSAERPIEIDLPIMITGMSWGALSANAKTALARGAARVGSSNTTGDGGMLRAERDNSRTLIY